MLSKAIANSSAAGFINWQCDGTDTGNGNARLAPAALHKIFARSTASLLPAITTWPGELKLTGETTWPSAASTHAFAIDSLSKPMMADIAPTPAGTAFCIN